MKPSRPNSDFSYLDCVLRNLRSRARPTTWGKS